MTANSTINCPKCDTSINVNEIITEKIKRSMKKDFFKKEKELKEQQESLRIQKKNQDEILQKKMKEIEKEMKKESIEEAEEIYHLKIKSYKDDLNEKNERLKKLYEIEAENDKLKRDNELTEMRIKKQLLKDFNIQSEKKEEELRKTLEEDYITKVRKLEKKLTEQKKLTDEQKRKLDQGSMQLQGEIQELIIEDWLKATYPFDDILEVKKGQNGADIIQTINSTNNGNNGIIYIESKNTKVFQKKWITKIKRDIKEINANIGVIVTKTMPSECSKEFTIIGGIYICTFSHFKSISHILRQMQINFNHTMKSQENKGDKMIALYDYFMSVDFKNNLEGLIDGYTEMEKLLLNEKRAINLNWKKRENQNEMMRNYISDLYINLKTISSFENFRLKEFDLDKLN